MINYQSKNALVFLYPLGAGGKFLTNCIGMSSQAVLQDAELVLQQLANQLSTSDKYDLLMQRVADAKNTGTWNDLDLGCGQLLRSPGSTLAMSALTDQDLRFCVTAHSVTEFVTTHNTWPNAEVVHLTNHQNFLNYCRPNWPSKNLRDNKPQQFWNMIREPTWSEHAPATVEEYHQLSDEVKCRDQDQKILKSLVRLEKFNNAVASAVTWNCDWFLTETQTVLEVEKLYQQFELKDFNARRIENFYRAWIDCLLTINKK